MVALPFSKLVCNVGNPIFVPKKATPQEFEQIRHDLEEFMVKQMRELDAEFGLKPAEQDLTATEFKNMKREKRAAKKVKNK